MTIISPQPPKRLHPRLSWGKRHCAASVYDFRGNIWLCNNDLPCPDHSKAPR